MTAKGKRYADALDFFCLRKVTETKRNQKCFQICLSGKMHEYCTKLTKWRFFREKSHDGCRYSYKDREFSLFTSISYINVKQFFRAAVVGQLRMDKVEETYVLEITQVFSSSAVTVTDEKKLKLTREDVNTIRSLLDKLDECLQQLYHVLVRKFSICVQFKRHSFEANSSHSLHWVLMESLIVWNAE